MIKKNWIQSDIINQYRKSEKMKDYLINFLRVSILYGTVMGLLIGVPAAIFAGIDTGLKGGIIFGTIMGMLFGLYACVFAEFQSRNFEKTTSQITGGRNVLKKGPANHFMNGESVGGYLFLLDEIIIFKSHNVNINKHQIILPYKKIVDIKPSLTLGLVPNGMKITTSGGEVEQFVVNGRKDWVRKIENARASYIDS